MIHYELRLASNQQVDLFRWTDDDTARRLIATYPDAYNAVKGNPELKFQQVPKSMRQTAPGAHNLLYVAIG